MNFAGGSQCSQPLQCIEEMVCAWEGINMTATEPTTFFVKIGSSGGLRGYQAITGKLKIAVHRESENISIVVRSLASADNFMLTVTR